MIRKRHTPRLQPRGKMALASARHYFKDKTMISIRPRFAKNFPRKTNISALFSATPKTFDDIRREWCFLLAQERVATSVGLREYFARQRTRLLEQFPPHEIPSVLDRLNATLEVEESPYAKAN